MKYFPPKRNFSSLSLSDLIDAREAYHVHLDSLDHVVATAIGRFYIRVSDDDIKVPEKFKRYGAGGPRTFANSKVKDWSWPCVLVLVDKWFTFEELGKQPDQTVPRLLYMPDGRVVPTCVMYVEAPPKEEARVEHLSFSSKTLGGGYSCVTESQQVQRMGTIGCLARKEGELYALTCGHVAGFEENEVFTYIRSNKESIGVSHPVRLAKKKFGEVYPKWTGDRTLVNGPNPKRLS